MMGSTIMNEGGLELFCITASILILLVMLLSRFGVTIDVDKAPISTVVFDLYLIAAVLLEDHLPT
jgi:hypothetical protein